MRRTQQNPKSVFLLAVYLCFFLLSDAKNSVSRVYYDQIDRSDITNLLNKADYHFILGQYGQSIKQYHDLLEKEYPDKDYIYQKLAFAYAKSNQPKLASEYIEEYIFSSLDVSFIGHSYFDNIRRTEPYRLLEKKYKKRINVWALFCLYVGFIGIFVFTILTIKKGKDKVANYLISCFLLLHSIFIIRVSILLTNYEYYLPHTLYVSASFSLLYGPLIYFYFKRVATRYQFKRIDLFHLFPTALFIVLMIPIYTLPTEEKLRMILHNERPYIVIIMVAKLISLLIYGVLVIKIYLKHVRKNQRFSASERIWQRNIILFCSVYTISYAIYAVFIKEYVVSSFLFHLQIILMSLLVLYISYNAFTQLNVLINIKGSTSIDKMKYNKYRKSNLTAGLSLELKEKLMILLDEEKVYLQNDITLQKVADLLETSRNNASQVINEHFHLNFFELINSYRIKEAKQILKTEREHVNIIDVAYEVGFNNKVTFNKSFKKYNQTTPSEYLKSVS